MNQLNRIRLLALLLAGVILLAGCAPGESEPPATTGNGSGGLLCLQYSKFSGTFPEDGTGRQVKNVAAILVHNSSDEYLDYADVTCVIGSESGAFHVTGLPPGATAWVLEKDAKTVAADDYFGAMQCKEYAFRADAVMSTDKLSVKAEGNTLTVTNRSNKTLENACLYYKTVHGDGHYFGGITYMLNFGTLEPGASAQKQSSHFGSQSRIVRYSFQES